MDGNLEATAGRIAEAIDWAVEQDVDIINMSFGLAKNVKELEEAVERAAEAGIFGGVTGVSGTSMAAPHVTGAASILMELNLELPADYIRMLLNYSANLYGTPDEYGNGVLDLGYALEINDKFKKLYGKHIDKAVLGRGLKGDTGK